MIAARARSLTRRHDVGRGRALAPHAHVERPFAPKREAPRGLVELHGRNAEVEQNAIDRRRAGDQAQIGKPVFDEIETPAGFCYEPRALRDRALIAVNADDPRAGRLQNRARVAAAAKRRVHINTAVVHREPLDRAADKHGNMPGHAFNDSPAVAHHHYSPPRGRPDDRVR